MPRVTFGSSRVRASRTLESVRAKAERLSYSTIPPPFGYNLFLIKAMAAKEVTLADIYRSIVPFVLVMILGLALETLFPQIAQWLPNLHYEK